MGWKYSSDLSDAFFVKLVDLGRRHNQDPEILTRVWNIESAGVNPRARNPNGGAVGLNQMMPATLAGMGVDYASFANASAEEQLDTIERFLAYNWKLNGGPFLTAGRYYQANFLPATLLTAKEPEDTIVAKGDARGFYAANAGLDYNKDGRITIADLEAITSAHAQTNRYKEIAARILWAKSQPAPLPAWVIVPPPTPAAVAKRAAELLGVLELGQSTIETIGSMQYRYVCETHPGDKYHPLPHKGVTVWQRPVPLVVPAPTAAGGDSSSSAPPQPAPDSTGTDGSSVDLESDPDDDEQCE